MGVTYSAHAEQKLSIRKVRRKDAEDLIANPAALFDDTEHNAKVAIGPLGEATLVAVYLGGDQDIKVIARKIDRLVSSKTERGAWKRIQ